MPERHVQKLKNDTGLDLEFFFGDTPSAAQATDPTNVRQPQGSWAMTGPHPFTTHGRQKKTDLLLHPQAEASAYPSSTEFTSALIQLRSNLHSLTLQNAPLAQELCEAIEQLTQLTHLDLSTSEKVYTSAGDRVGGVERPDSATWSKWRHQSSTHGTQHVALPNAMLHCTRLEVSKMSGLQRLSVRGQQGLPWAALETMTRLKALTALDIAHSIDMPNTALYQVCSRGRALLPQCMHMPPSALLPCVVSRWRSPAHALRLWTAHGGNEPSTSAVLLCICISVVLKLTHGARARLRACSRNGRAAVPCCLRPLRTPCMRGRS